MSVLADHLVTCMVFLPLAAALLAMTFPKDNASGVLGFALLIMLADLGLGIFAVSQYDRGSGALQFVESLSWIPAWGARYAVGVDGLALILMLLTQVMTPMCLWAAGLHQEELLRGKQRLWAICLLLLEAAVLGAFAALDVLLFYIFFEAMLIPAYFLIALSHTEASTKAARRFFLFTMAGSMAMLTALVYLGLIAFLPEAPSFLWVDIMARIASQPVSYTEVALFLAMTLAFAIKIPMLPWHGWLPSTYFEAPQSVTVMLSAVMVKVGAFGLLRYGLVMFPRSATFMMPTLSALAVLGILYAACTAISQQSIRRVLAYSSISHMGFIVLGLCSMAPDALLGSALQMVNHAISTGALFVLLGLVVKRCQTDTLDQLGGLATRAPMLAAAFVVMALSSLGLPGLNGFVGEFLILMGTFNSDGLSVSLTTGALCQAAILTVTALLMFVAYRMLRALFVWGGTRTGSQPYPVVLVACGSLAIVAGFLAVAWPPLGTAPSGILLRPLYAHALSVMPFTQWMSAAAVLATLGVLLGAVYLLKVVEQTFFGPQRMQRGDAAAAPMIDLSASERWLVLPFVASALLLGLYPAPISRFLEPTMRHYAEQFRSQAGWPKALDESALDDRHHD